MSVLADDDVILHEDAERAGDVNNQRGFRNFRRPYSRVNRFAHDDGFRVWQHLADVASSAPVRLGPQAEASMAKLQVGSETKVAELPHKQTSRLDLLLLRLP
jgi:hypothetical protein